VSVATSPLHARKAITLPPFERECADLFGQMAQALGIPRSIGQIYGVLFASPHPLSFSDIVERLDISKGSASEGLQILRTLGAITFAKTQFTQVDNRVANGHTRRGTLYEPELSLRKLMHGVLREKAGSVTFGSNAFAKLQSLAESCETGGDFYRGRVKQLKTWKRRLAKILPILNLLLGPKGAK